MNINAQNTSTIDQALASIPGLTWLPWVGSNYANMPGGERVLIVAESHYSNEQDPEKVTLSLDETTNNRTYTRAVVQESLVDEDWSTRTLSTMHQLFYSPANRAGFWANLSFYNLVQRPMWYREGSPERPSWEDFWKGWEVFLQVIAVLKPDHVLFIGVEAANHFNGFMANRGQPHTGITFPEKIGSAYARSASVEISDRTFPLHFIKHCGSYFSTESWQDYLHRAARPMMASIAASAGSILPEVSTSRLHILGMAKSSLDLRGAKAPKLELDFLRLAYAVRDFREAGEDAIGYLMVLMPDVAATAAKWIGKYNTGDGVVVLCQQVDDDAFDALKKEKSDNAIGFIRERCFEEAELELSLADLGKTLGEKALRDAIESRYGKVTPDEKLPLGIAWDFYGTVSTAN